MNQRYVFALGGVEVVGYQLDIARFANRRGRRKFIPVFGTPQFQQAARDYTVFTLNALGAQARASIPIAQGYDYNRPENLSQSA